MNRAAKTAWLASLTSYFLLIGLLYSWLVWIAPPENGKLAVYLLVGLLPLLWPLRGLLYGRPRTHAWSNYIILLYFCHGLVSAWQPGPEQWLAVTEVALCLSFFFANIAYIRRRSAEQDS